jgi:hypothetical protein
LYDVKSLTIESDSVTAHHTSRVSSAHHMAAQSPRPTEGTTGAARATTRQDPAAERQFHRRFDCHQLSKFTYCSWRTNKTVEAVHKANVRRFFGRVSRPTTNTSSPWRAQLLQCIRRAKLFCEDLRPITIGTGSERRFMCMRPDINGTGLAREGLARIIRTEVNVAAAARAAAELALLPLGATVAALADPYGLSLDEMDEMDEMTRDWFAPAGNRSYRYSLRAVKRDWLALRFAQSQSPTNSSSCSSSSQPAAAVLAAGCEKSQGHSAAGMLASRNS